MDLERIEEVLHDLKKYQYQSPGIMADAVEVIESLLKTKKNRALSLEIKCGDRTCYGEEGPCRFLMTRRFGSINFCLLWNDEDYKGQKLHMAEDEEGRLLRRPECLEATGEGLK